MLSTSDAHNQAKQIRMSNVNKCKAQSKERESLEIMDQTQTPRYVSRLEPLLYVPAFTQKDFHYSVHTGLPTQGTSTEYLGNTNREYTTPLSINTTSTQEARHNTNHHYT